MIVGNEMKIWSRTESRPEGLDGKIYVVMKGSIGCIFVCVCFEKTFLLRERFQREEEYESL